MVGNFCGIHGSSYPQKLINFIQLYREYMPQKYKYTKLSGLSKPQKFTPSKKTIDTDGTVPSAVGNDTCWDESKMQLPTY